MLFGRNCHRYIVHVATKKVDWGLEREIVDFEKSLLETHWGVKKYESHYMPEVIINVTERAPWEFVK